MPLGSSPTAAWLGPIRGRKPNPQAGKTSRRRLVGVCRGAPAPRCDRTASSPHGDFGASGTFFRLSPGRPAPGFSSRTGPNRFHGGARISRVWQPAPAGRRHAATGEKLRAAGRARQSGNGCESARNRRRSRTCGPPTSRGSCRFPGRLAAVPRALSGVRRAACVRPATPPASLAGPTL
jgi:hypothetical protein